MIARFFVFCVIVFMTHALGYAAYQTQGFTVFQEQGNMVNFQCDKQCFVLMGMLGSNDMVSFSGPTEGEGKIGRGFLVGQQIYPGEIIEAGGTVSAQGVFHTHQLYTQLPKDQTQVVLLVDGAVKSSGLTIEFGKMFLGEKIASWRKEFWINEPLRPYSINLRYGVKIGGVSLVKIGYWVFVIGVCIILLFVGKKERTQTILLFGITLMLLFSLRNLRNRTDWTKTGMRTYSNVSESQKSFFDLGDYPVFIAKMREILDLDSQFGKTSCTVYFDAFQEWPFKVHADTVYIKPCEPAKDKISADFIVFYKKAIDPEFASKEVLLDRNGSFLIHNKQ